ncbi:hypothetical protein HCJ76_00360 [Streptomyces sp. MC1]|uniref:hypothetical protein n=1 Tax=Streptomyces sp. MC1 TaxID=295105 RepID=UPI0018C947EA|nr:hypothetical protein [Streptomyces sp. MC1]MBG7696595.1 hypothetical protein [Streptomyces sp. MC1]
MAGHRKISSTDEPEEPELFRVRRPSSNQVGLYCLALVEAAHLAQDQPGAAAAVAVVASGALMKGCVWRRKR